METVPFDIRNAPVIKLTEDDVETLRGSNQISLNVFNYLLQASTLVQGQREFVALTSTDFLDIMVTSDLHAYNKMNRRKGADSRSSISLQRFSVLEKWEENKFRLLIPMIKGKECAFIIVDVSDSVDIVSYEHIIIYSIYNNHRPRTRNNINLSSAELECLCMVDRWLAVCLRRSSNTVNDLKSIATKRTRPNAICNSFDARLFCATIALKYCQDPNLEDVSLTQSDVTRLRKHLQRTLPLEERIHIVKKLGREIYEIISGRSIPQKIHRRNVMPTRQVDRESTTGAASKPTPSLLSEQYPNSLPRSERMYDPNRERDYREWKRLKVEKIKERIKKLNELLENDETTWRETFNNSLNGSSLDPSKELEALMSCSSDDSDDGVNNKKSNVSNSNYQKAKIGSRKGVGGMIDSTDDVACIPVHQFNQNSDVNSGFNGNSTVNPNCNERNRVGGQGEGDKHQASEGDNLVDDVHGGDLNGNIINNIYEEGVGQDSNNDNQEDVRTDEANEISIIDDHYEEPKRKKKTPHSLSATTPDSECFYDGNFFPEAGNKFYGSIEEAKREVIDYRVSSNFYVSISKSSPRYLLAYCKSHAGCPCHVQVGPVQDPRGAFVVKKVDRRHRDTEVITHGPGGRRYKQRKRVYAPASSNCEDQNIAHTSS